MFVVKDLTVGLSTTVFYNTNLMVSGILWAQLLEGTAGTSVEDGRNVQVECDVVESLHAAHLLPASIRLW